MKKLLACALLGAVTITGVNLASAEDEIADAIKHRQAGYSFMAWNMGKIKAQTIDAPETFNKDQVAAAANAIAAIANSGMGALYPAGSDKGKGFRPTKLKPEFFQKGEEVGKIAGKFNKAANNLATVAAAGNPKDIAKAFGEVGQSCKACHDQFRAK